MSREFTDEEYKVFVKVYNKAAKLRQSRNFWHIFSSVFVGVSWDAMWDKHGYFIVVPIAFSIGLAFLFRWVLSIPKQRSYEPKDYS